MQTKNRICRSNGVVSPAKQSSKTSSENAVSDSRGALRKIRLFTLMRRLGRLEYQNSKKSELSPSNQLLELDKSILLSNYGSKILEMLLDPGKEAKSGCNAQVFGYDAKEHEISERKEIVLPLSSPCHDIIVAGHKGFAASECLQCLQPNIIRELPLTTREDVRRLLDQGSIVVDFVDQKQAFHSRTGSDTSLFSTAESSSFSSRSETGSFTRAESHVVGFLSSENLRSKSCSHSSLPGAAQKFSFSNLNPQICALRSSSTIAADAINGNYIEFKVLDGRLVESESKAFCSSYVIDEDCGSTESEMQEHSLELLKNNVKENMNVDTIGRPLLICSTSEKNLDCSIGSDTSSTKHFTSSFKLLPEEVQNISSDSFDFRGSKCADDSLKIDVLYKTLSSANGHSSDVDEVESYRNFTDIACKLHSNGMVDLKPCPSEENSCGSFDFGNPKREFTTAHSHTVACKDIISAQKMCSQEKPLSGQFSRNVAPVETQCKKFTQDRCDSTSIVRPFLGSSLKKDLFVTSGIRRKPSPLNSAITQRSLSEFLMFPRKKNTNVPAKALHFRSPNTVVFNENTVNWCADSQDNFPALKNNRCIPTPKIALCSGKPRLATSKQNHSSKRFPLTERPFDPSTVVEGRLHCMIRDGVPSYSLLLNGSDQILVASTMKIESHEQELTYAFYSCKGKGKGAVGWKSWRKKERSASTFLGLMKLTSKFPDENEHPNEGKSNFVNLEFVFLGNEEKEHLPSFSAGSPRESISSQASMFSKSPESLSSSPSCFSPLSEFCDKLSPSPTMLGLPSPRLYDSPFSSHYISLSMVPRSIVSPLTTVSSRKVERRPRSGSSHCSPASTKEGEENNLAEKFWIDLSGTHNTGMGCTNKSYLERVAAVIRMPLEVDVTRSLDDTLNIGQKWGWEGKNRNMILINGRNGCMETAKENNFNRECETQTCVEGWGSHCKLNPDSSKENATGDCLLCISEGRENGGFRLATQELTVAQSKGQVTVTIILPAGKHGRPLYGMAGPQPLIDRWRSGGQCDCGSWDLGCGLTILDSELPRSFTSDDKFLAEERPAAEMKSKPNTLKMFMQAKKEQGAIMGLTPLQDGLYSLTFRSPLSALQAFASSVAILYSMGPMIPVTKQEAVKVARKPPRIPLRPLTTSVFPTSQEHMAVAPWRRFYGEYSNPDPPLSPIERL